MADYNNTKLIFYFTFLFSSIATATILLYIPVLLNEFNLLIENVDDNMRVFRGDTNIAMTLLDAFEESPHSISHIFLSHQNSLQKLSAEIAEIVWGKKSRQAKNAQQQVFPSPTVLSTVEPFPLTDHLKYPTAHKFAGEYQEKSHIDNEFLNDRTIVTVAEIEEPATFVIENIQTMPTSTHDIIKDNSYPTPPKVDSYQTISTTPGVFKEEYQTSPKTYQTSPTILKEYQTVPTTIKIDSYQTPPTTVKAEAYQTLPTTAKTEDYQTLPSTVKETYQTVPTTVKETYQTVSTTAKETYQTLPTTIKVDSYQTIPTTAKVDSYQTAPTTIKSDTYEILPTTTVSIDSYQTVPTTIKSKSYETLPTVKIDTYPTANTETYMTFPTTVKIESTTPPIVETFVIDSNTPSSPLETYKIMPQHYETVLKNVPKESPSNYVTMPFPQPLLTEEKCPQETYINPMCPAGPKGPTGNKGVGGEDGKDGIPGQPGLDFAITMDKQEEDVYAVKTKRPCIKCPGNPGKRGEKGRTGPLGKKGRNGLTGLTGLTGQDGLKGEVGDNGLDGEPGIGVTLIIRKGMPGERGKPGEKGDDGYPGVTGLSGIDARRGARGETGEIGQPGPSGLIGPPGVSGIPGIMGEQQQHYCNCPRRNEAVQTTSTPIYQ